MTDDPDHEETTLTRDEAVEKVARYICAEMGINPDAPCMRKSPAVQTFGEDWYIGGKIHAAWEMYASVAALAIQGLENTGAEISDEMRAFPDEPSADPEWRATMGLR